MPFLTGFFKLSKKEKDLTNAIPGRGRLKKI